MQNEATLNSTELPVAGADQPSGASQAAAEPIAPAALGPAARLYESEAGAAQQQQAPDEKPAPSAHEGVAADGNPPQDEPAGAAPAHYEFKPVEGVKLSDDVIGKFSEVAQSLNLSQGAAQKMLDEVAPAIARQQHAAMRELNAQWVNAVKADKEIGGDKLHANLAIAKKARDAFGSDGLRQLLNDTRLGDHPEVVRFFFRAGRAISEDSFVPGGAKPASGSRDAATVLYGKSN